MAPRKRPRYRIIATPGGGKIVFDRVARSWAATDAERYLVDYGRMDNARWTRYLDPMKRY